MKIQGSKTIEELRILFLAQSYNRDNPSWKELFNVHLAEKAKTSRQR